MKRALVNNDSAALDNFVYSELTNSSGTRVASAKRSRTKHLPFGCALNGRQLSHARSDLEPCVYTLFGGVELFSPKHCCATSTHNHRRWPGGRRAVLKHVHNACRFVGRFPIQLRKLYLPAKQKLRQPVNCFRNIANTKRSRHGNPGPAVHLSHV